MKTTFYKKATNLYNKGLFDILKMGTLFAVKVKKDTYYCVIEEDSIFMYKNQRGFESWIDLISQEDEISDLKALELEYMKYGLSISFSQYEDLNKYEQKELIKLNLEYSETDLIPRFLHHEELTLPYRIKEDDFESINALLFSLEDIIDNNQKLFEEDEKILSEEEMEDEELDDEIYCSICNLPEKTTKWIKIDLPEDFERFPSPTLMEKSIVKYKNCKNLKNKEWNLHLFIVPNANNNKAHLFPIAGILFDNNSKEIISYNLVKDWESYFHDFLEEFLISIKDLGKPSVLNVSSHRAEALFKGLCKQLNIPLVCYSNFEDTDTMEVQLLKNYNY